MSQRWDRSARATAGARCRAGGGQLGIVSNNPSCDPAAPNAYTNVAAGEIQEFIKGNPSPPLAPIGGQDVSLLAPAAAPRQGDTATCSAGTWSNSPSFTYVFTDTSTGKELQRGPSTVYTITGTSDAGATISCRAQAANAGGVGLTPPTMATAPVVAAPTPAPAPTPTPPTPTAPRDRLSLSLRATVRHATTSSRSRARRGHAAASSKKLRVRRGDKVTFTLSVRNKGNRPATNVRRCTRLSSRFTLVSRGKGKGKGKVSKGKLCFSTSSLPTGRTTRSRFVVRIDRDAGLGRLAIRASARSSQGASASAKQTLIILRAGRRPAPRPPFVTG